MNCIEFRRMLRAGVAASGAPEEMREHGLSCANCSAGFAEQQAFEAELGRTLAFPVDTDFAERMVAAVHAVDQPTALPRRDRRRILAIAASVIAAGGVGSYLWIDRNDPLALACIQFVIKEETKSIMMGAMPREEAALAIASAIAIARIEAMGQIKHIAPCPFNGGTAYHVVLAVPQDKVTLFIMPTTPLPARRAALLDGMHAAVVPAGTGAIGIVGSNRDVVISIAGALRQG